MDGPLGNGAVHTHRDYSAGATFYQIGECTFGAIKTDSSLIRRGKFFYGKYSNVETRAPEQFFPYRSGLGVGSGTSARGDATGAGIGGGA